MVNIGIGPRHGNDCCICCPKNRRGDSCYCNCCACPHEGDLCFEMVACQITYPVVQDCSCDDFKFTFKQRTDECYEHTAGGGSCTQCESEYMGSPQKGTGLNGYPEAWGFSGKVCTGCVTTATESNCSGMCITASLCCCRTGIEVTDSGEVIPPSDHPCPIAGRTRCLQGESNPPDGPYTCHMKCFWFEMEPYNCYDSNDDGIADTPCSPCSWRDRPPWLPPGTDAGFVGSPNCATIISGQCPCPPCKDDEGNPAPKKFLMLVEGEMQINCDCQTGWMPPSGPGGIVPVTMKYTGCISSCEDNYCAGL